MKLKLSTLLISVLVLFYLFATVPVVMARMLVVHPSNPRYFTDGSGRAIYLTGSHTWANFQDQGVISRPPPFDYPAYLNFLKRHNHNFIRLWTWEHTKSNNTEYFYPSAYVRNGTGRALDGEPKFDVRQFNQQYFDRLRSRVIMARDRGIYVSIMLFQGWSITSNNPALDPWSGHPLNPNNNVNGINGDVNGNGQGEEVHTLAVPAIAALQEAYVRKVVDTVNDLDNVLYEIANESPEGSLPWQEHMIKYIHNYEARKAQQHPVWITNPMSFKNPRGWQFNAIMSKSSAEAIAPNEFGGYLDNPPINNGTKIMLTDTDHLWGIGGNPEWVWKSFTRGLNPIFMDPVDDSKWESVRRAMGQTLTFARRMNLSGMTPRNDLCSTTYCLANPGVEYLVYVPPGFHWLERWIELMPYRLESWVKSWVKWTGMLTQTITIDLTPASGALDIECFEPTTGETRSLGKISGGARRSINAPFGDAILYFKASGNLSQANTFDESPGGKVLPSAATKP